jgi:hypothetical protein
MKERYFYFEDVKEFAKWYKKQNKVPMDVAAMLQEPFLSRLTILMGEENELRFQKRSVGNSGPMPALSDYINSLSDENKKARMKDCQDAYVQWCKDNPEKKEEFSSLGGQACRDLGVGYFKYTEEERIKFLTDNATFETRSKGGQSNVKNGTGFFKYTPEERLAINKNGGAATAAVLKARTLSRKLEVVKDLPSGWFTKKTAIEWFLNSEYMTKWNLKSATFMHTTLKDSEFFESKMEGIYKMYKVIKK